MSHPKRYSILSIIWNNLDNKVWFCIIFIASAIAYSVEVAQFLQLGKLADLMKSKDFDLSFAVTPLLIILACVATEHAGRRLSVMASVASVPKLMSNIRVSLTKDTISRDINLFNTVLSGVISHKINQLPLTISSIIQSFQWFFLKGIIVIVLTLALGFSMDVYIGLLVVLWCLVHGTLSTIFLRGVLYETSHNLSRDRSRMAGSVADVVSNISLVLTSKEGAVNSPDFLKTVESDYQSTKRHKRLYGYFGLVMAICDTSFLAGTVYVAALFTQSGDITLGTFVTASFFFLRMSSSLWSFSKELNAFSENLASANESLALLSGYPLSDLESGTKLTLKKAPSLEFKDISFAYNALSTNTLFEGFNLNIKAGEKVGLIGHSGAGKSSLVSLVLSFYEPKSGHILLNGTDINTYSKNSYRQHISVISQDTSMFHQSVRDNIAYGMPNATNEDVENAAKQAYAHDFIMKLENGYDSMVGDRGVQLSGGQRQRIAIARAILKNSPIFILDEATSALDSQSEKYIQDSLKEVMKNKTVIAIAHRLSTISAMDRIVVLDAGKIVEEGAHEELLKRGGAYAKMWAMQSGGFLPDNDIQP